MIALTLFPQRSGFWLCQSGEAIENITPYMSGVYCDHLTQATRMQKSMSMQTQMQMQV